MTADGIISLLEPDNPDPSIGLSGAGITLKQFLETNKKIIAEGAITDSRLLQYGWVKADAVISGGNILHVQHDLDWIPWDEDMREEFDAVHKGRLPLRVLVTGIGFSAEEMKKYPVLNPNNKLFRTFVATIDTGFAFMKENINEGNGFPFETRSFGETHVNFAQLFNVLYDEFNIKFVDIQGGPTLTGQLVEHNLIDEYRQTISPSIAGYKAGNGKHRPGPVAASLGSLDLKLLNIRMLGIYKNHIFLRYAIEKPELKKRNMIRISNFL